MVNTYSIISNTDGSTRWLWPVGNSKPIFLKFYPSSTLKQRTFKWVIQLIFRLRVQRFFFKTTTEVPAGIQPQEKEWALFFGTPGPNNKKVLYERSMSGQGKFTKIAFQSTAEKNISLEKHYLDFLANQANAFSFEFPFVYQEKDPTSLCTNEIPFVRSRSKWTPKHSQAIQELSLVNSTTNPIGNWYQWNAIEERISWLNTSENQVKIPKNFTEKLCLVRKEINVDEHYDFHFAHGDFTPWNSFETKGKKLAIIDWELAQFSAPRGFDFFHFNIQNGILVERLNAKDLIQKTVDLGLKEGVFSSEEELMKYFKISLLYHISYYSHLYANQENWHVQINWQLAVWDELLNQMIKSRDLRRLFLGDFFQFLKDVDYGGLKMPLGHPQDLSLDSDLDLLIFKKDLKKITKWIENRGIVFKSRLKIRSNFTAVSILLFDGSRLHIDLIVQLKRKSKVFKNITTCIQNSKMNSFDVKVCNQKDTAEYIGLFYGLNGASIPKKYLIKADDIIPIKTNLEESVYNFYQDPKKYESILRKNVNNLPENIGWKGLKNKFHYAVDSFKSLFHQKGIIITFSGVDGAGKSTVIEEIKQKFDKRYRKPVVVLRHRPSLIPILSAYKYGKTEAENRSVQSLPRQGNNQSKLKSILRFAYYYSDYFFGQFYIYFRYVLRGYVVIYDRYYFDMINDGKRSNMILPKSLTNFGYRFLLKPDFNFFLYASPETILQRKQELESDTIRKLTRDYKQLFERFSKRSVRSKYVSIDNEILGLTTSEIFQTIGLIY